MTDDFLQEIRPAWQSLDTDLAQVRRKLKRSRWVPHATLVLEIVGAMVGFAAGLWFFRMAALTHEPIFMLAGAVMLSTMPAAILISVLIRKNSLRWEEETPESVVQVGLRRTRATLLAIHTNYYGIGIVASFVGLLWFAQLFGFVDEQGFVIFYSLVSAAICTIMLFYLAWRKGLAMQSLTAYQVLLDNLRDAGVDAKLKE